MMARRLLAGVLPKLAILAILVLALLLLPLAEPPTTTGVRVYGPVARCDLGNATRRRRDRA